MFTAKSKYRHSEEKCLGMIDRLLHAKGTWQTLISRIVISLSILLFPLNVLAQQRAPLLIKPTGPDIPIPPSPDEGQDPTRTQRRFDFRYAYGHLNNSNNAHIFTFRTDNVLKLNTQGTWRISGRFELPFVYTNIPRNNQLNPPSEAFHFGTGNILAQALAIHDIDERTAIAFGSAFIIPTATQGNRENRQYRLLPTIVARWMLPEISAGSYFAPTGRYNFSIAGPAGFNNRPHISELQFSPTINIRLPNLWFITLFPGTSGGDIRYNLGQPQSGDKGRLFLPADFMIGKMLGPNTVTSLEVGFPIVNDYRTSALLGTYNFKLEARIGFFW
jgi:hypothetical protein